MTGVLVVVPTYDEIDNIASILDRTRAAVPDVHVLVVDDASPDGTGVYAAARAERDPNVFVLNRTGKGGLGAAYLAGFAWALERRFDVIVEMDADGSHAPEDIPRLLAVIATADVVLGSRWVAGGATRGWPLRRQLLSRAGNLYVRAALGTRLRDATGGFRAYRREVLEDVCRTEVTSTGYCFQIDLARRCERAGYLVVETPITFTEREYGISKMSGAIVGEALRRTTIWGLREQTRRFVRLLARVRHPGRHRCGPSRTGSAGRQPDRDRVVA